MRHTKTTVPSNVLTSLETCRFAVRWYVLCNVFNRIVAGARRERKTAPSGDAKTCGTMPHGSVRAQLYVAQNRDLDFETSYNFRKLYDAASSQATYRVSYSVQLSGLTAGWEWPFSDGSPVAMVVCGNRRSRDLRFSRPPIMQQTLMVNFEKCQR